MNQDFHDPVTDHEKHGGRGVSSANGSGDSNALAASRGLIVAGMQSGSGKTAVTALLLAAARARGLPVQPFKVGPDYLDPGYHQFYAGVPSRNLDSWLMRDFAADSTPGGMSSGRAGVLAEVARWGTGKLCIVEGVMGLFDGGDPASDTGSAMEIARWLDWPVLLVVPCAKTGRSLAAAVRGFIAEAGEGRIAGLVLNGVSGDSHADFLTTALAASGITVPVLGVLPELQELRWPERPLGLKTAHEAGNRLPTLETLSGIAERSFNLEVIFSTGVGAAFALAGGKTEVISPISELRKAPSSHINLNTQKKRIALARDDAFHFYYPSNLDWLRTQNVEIAEFSPLADRELPANISGIILGGGFPEIFAEKLASNTGLFTEIRNALANGLPCYAECGGLMLLSEGIIGLDGQRHPMCGVIPGSVEMTRRLVNFGYCSAAHPAFEAARFHAHEFHHSRWLGEAEHANLWDVTHRRSGIVRREGYGTGTLHASYLHLYWPAASALFERLFFGESKVEAASCRLGLGKRQDAASTSTAQVPNPISL